MQNKRGHPAFVLVEKDYDLHHQDRSEYEEVQRWSSLIPGQARVSGLKIGLCVNKPLTKADIPAGTEVWKVANNEP
jgi:hypothetical protein